MTPGGGSAAELLAAYDRQLRGPEVFSTTPGALVVEDGPLLRVTGLQGRGMVMARGPQEMAGSDVGLLIAHQVEVFSDLGSPFEWKTFSHDQPPDLPSRLRLEGLEEGECEVVMVASAADLAGERDPPPGVEIRELRSADDFARLAVHLSEVWGEDMGAPAAAYQAAAQAFPQLVVVLAAEVSGRIISSARAEVVPGTEFCGLWGGSTLAGWRGRGLYRELLARRAELARRHGCRLLQVDALPSSRRILERLGFTAVTTSTPFHWAPPEATASAPDQST